MAARQLGNLAAWQLGSLATVSAQKNRDPRPHSSSRTRRGPPAQKSLGMPVDAEADGIGLATPRAGASPGGAFGASPMDLTVRAARGA